MRPEGREFTRRAIPALSCLAVDAHVHLHDGEASLQVAARNVARFCPEAQAGVLLLAERAGETLFASLRDHPPAGLHATGDPVTLFYDAGTLPLLIVAGRQVVTAEAIEVLLLGTLDAADDGRGIEQTLRQGAPGALAVLPWGFGKWIGRRGAVVAAMLAERGDVFAGDIQTRPSWLASPTLRRTIRSGRPIMSGTDSLPMDGDRERVGAFGQVLHTSIDPERPAASILAAMKQPGHRIYGHRATTTGAVRQQIAWHRGGRRRAA